MSLSISFMWTLARETVGVVITICILAWILIQSDSMFWQVLCNFGVTWPTTTYGNSPFPALIDSPGFFLYKLMNSIHFSLTLSAQLRRASNGENPQNVPASLLIELDCSIRSPNNHSLFPLRSCLFKSLEGMSNEMSKMPVWKPRRHEILWWMWG